MDTKEASHEGLATLDDQLTGYPPRCPIEHDAEANSLRYIRQKSGLSLALLLGRQN